jgi:hypothetical protein
MMRVSAGRAIALRLALVFAVLSLLLAGCGESNTSPQPSPSLITLSFSPIPTATPPSSATHASPSASVVAGWPPGWDVDFCAMFDGAVTAQQLIVDVERAIDDGATRDAKGLARDLAQSAAQTTDLVAALPQWDPASDALSEINTLMDYGSRASAQYTKYFKSGVQADLKKARSLRRQDAAEVPTANQQLALLADAGLVCPKHDLQLESP